MMMTRIRWIGGLLVLVVCLQAGGRQVAAQNDERAAFYVRVENLVATEKPDWRATLAELNKVRPEYMSHRFFYYRSLVYYMLEQVAAGDAEASICIVWASALTADEQSKIRANLLKVRNTALEFAKAKADTVVQNTPSSCKESVKQCPGMKTTSKFDP